MRTVLSTTLIILLFALPVYADTIGSIHVPGDQPTIQAGIDSAGHGDTVLVAPGTYKENIDFNGKAITVKSSGGAGVTVINGDYMGIVVRFWSGEGFDSVLEGFTLTRGGPGICCWYDSSPTIVNNIITGNKASSGGGILCGYQSSPSITNNTITGNTGGWGGGIYCTESSPNITNNTITGNWADSGGGIACFYKSSPTITNNVIVGNRAYNNGGGIYWWGSSPTITNNTISGNTGGVGGGIYCGYSSTAITNTILWDNSATTGPEIWVGDTTYPSTLTISYSNVKGGQASVYVDPGSTLNWGAGMINANPLFAAGASGFHYLSQVLAGQPANSPCVDTGSDLASNLGMNLYWTRTDEVPDSGTVDMGFHYGADFLFPSLQADAFAIPEKVGGTANFLLLAGAKNADRTYLLLGSISGTVKGIPLPGGKATLPLNYDIFTTMTILYANTQLFLDFMGTLDAMGSGAAQMNLGPVPGFAPLTMYFAYALNKPWDFASNPVGIEIVQ